MSRTENGKDFAGANRNAKLVRAISNLVRRSGWTTKPSAGSVLKCARKLACADRAVRAGCPAFCLRPV
jgi:hypothetical protein